MAIVSCAECSECVSNKAKACPKCGARVPRTKWWLWIPLTLIVAFFSIGLMVPENVAKGRELRKVCEQMYARGVVASIHECDQMYEDVKRRGKQ